MLNQYLDFLRKIISTPRPGKLRINECEGSAGPGEVGYRPPYPTQKEYRLGVCVVTIKGPTHISNNRYLTPVDIAYSFFNLII